MSVPMVIVQVSTWLEKLGHDASLPLPRPSTVAGEKPQPANAMASTAIRITSILDKVVLHRKCESVALHVASAGSAS